MKPIAKTKTDEVLSRLNKVRVSHADVIATTLPQIKFQASGLRSAELDAYISVKGMIAALELDQAALELAAEEMCAKFPDDLDGALNFMRSYGVSNQAEGAKRHAVRAVALGGGELVVRPVAETYIVLGEFEVAREFLAGLDDELLAPTDVYQVARYRSMMRAFQNHNVSGSEFRELVDAGREAVIKAGWPFPSECLLCAATGLDEDYPIVSLTYDVDCVPEQLLDLEESMLAAASGAGSRLFQEGLVSLQMSFS